MLKYRNGKNKSQNHILVSQKARVHVGEEKRAKRRKKRKKKEEEKSKNQVCLCLLTIGNWILGLWQGE